MSIQLPYGEERDPHDVRQVFAIADLTSQKSIITFTIINTC